MRRGDRGPTVVDVPAAASAAPLRGAAASGGWSRGRGSGHRARPPLLATPPRPALLAPPCAPARPCWPRRAPARGPRHRARISAARDPALDGAEFGLPPCVVRPPRRSSTAARCPAGLPCSGPQRRGRRQGGGEAAAPPTLLGRARDPSERRERRGRRLAVVGIRRRGGRPGLPCSSASPAPPRHHAGQGREGEGAPARHRSAGGRGSAGRSSPGPAGRSSPRARLPPRTHGKVNRG
ncbi:hypothetical protein PVAP13_1KG399000 [Panicum virgatum]|uniref:Uncharacterized protein n=1 Tax=Panicum virgatum TaxID=38727 RepID=A0A8T0XEI4_PANVG|nr:hypothetical protein PVAP13_1KG399000 [Panicum virgatum]